MQLLKESVGKKLKLVGLDPGMLERPPRPEMGDLAFPCFELAKKRKASPVEIAKELSKKISAKVRPGRPGEIIRMIEPLGPYINFHADWEKLGGTVIRDVLKEGDRYGSSPKGKKKVMVEFAHPNTHKAFHIGHLRTLTLGESLSRVKEAGGSKVIRANYQGDIGPHVARCLWGVMNLKSKEPAKGKGIWLGEMYAKASMKATNPEVEAEIRAINKDLYAGKPALVKMWKRTRKWSLEYYDGIYKDFGAKFDRLYFESEVEGSAVKLAKILVKKRIAKVSDGAIIIDLEKHKLGIFVLLTRDGTPLYSVKDFVLAELQDKEYKPNLIIHVVGSEQDMHFRQLFKSLEKISPRISKIERHLSYGLVNLESGKMKSREGKVILYEELLSKLMEIARKVSKAKNPKLSKGELDSIASMVAMGALKYDMIKISPEKTIVFDWDRALSFEGNNAPYLQYTHARCCSMLRKAGVKADYASAISKYDASLLGELREKAVIRQISDFPEAVGRSAREMRPHHIATYVYELCDAFNEFYQFVPVLKAEKETRTARLALVKAVQLTLRNGLRLLGIDAPERM